MTPDAEGTRGSQSLLPALASRPPSHGRWQSGKGVCRVPASASDAEASTLAQAGAVTVPISQRRKLRHGGIELLAQD